MAIETLIGVGSRRIREGLRCVIGDCDAFEVVAEARDSDEAIDLALERQPDLAVVEDDSPQFDGLRVIREVRRHQRYTRFLVFSTDREPRAAIAALRAGANGFVHKSASFAEIRAGARVVAAGSLHLERPLAVAVRCAATPRLTGRLLSSVLSPPQAASLCELLAETQRSEVRTELERRDRGCGRLALLEGNEERIGDRSAPTVAEEARDGGCPVA